jgi:ankyrin repeat protein
VPKLDRHGLHPLHWACRVANLPMMRFWLDYFIAVRNFTDQNLVCSGVTSMPKQPELARLLIDAGADMIWRRRGTVRRP